MAGARCVRFSRSPSPTGLRAPTPTSSFEVSSSAPTEEQTDPFDCCSETPCLRCVFYKSRCWGTTGAARWSNPVVRRPAPTAARSGSPSSDSMARRAGSGDRGDSGNGGNRSSSGQYGRAAPRSSGSSVPNGIEDSHWGGVVHEPLVLCRHCKHPYSLYTWDGKHYGRRYLGCPLKDKSESCGFVQWLDEEWPQRAQEVILTLWDMVNQTIEKADKNMVDMMAETAQKNEAKDQLEVLEGEKEGWEREKQELDWEKERLNLRWRFSQSCCTSFQTIMRTELEDKKRTWIVVVCLIGLLVTMLFIVVLKMK
ncbi:hypothetical protein PVAP13_7NG320850 [Panicum virgatum]|uniref:Zinc finger GRF-type domain-containing protein n=1 Tax=Panicum virgatum TaxID=38727 RepID=A0A8T0Q793_PANVG|nr:hypothetical protein PVAP13_7NG320850 [Panicum virgatum]